MTDPLIRVGELIGPYVRPVPPFEAHANPLRTLVREAAQNSWDARGEDTPMFHVDVTQLSGLQADYLLSLLGTDDVPGLPSFEQIKQGTPIIIVRDERTCGLDGDLTRSATEVGGRWWRFVGNYGDRAVADAAGGAALGGAGGSFGLGKLAYFGASMSRLVVIHSQVRLADGDLQTRFLIYGIGDTRPDHNFTGRHWWGLSGEAMNEEIPLPIIGNEADVHAAALGLPPFDKDTTGTTFAIINAAAPPEADESYEQTVCRSEFIRECLLWNLWPKYSFTDAPMTISLSEDGRKIPLIKAEDHPVAKHFVRAYQAAASDESPAGTKKAVVTHSRNPILHVGVAIEAWTEQVTDTQMQLIEAAGGPTLPLRHVMLLRDPRLVVCYREAVGQAIAEEHPIAGAALPPKLGRATIRNLGLPLVDEILRRSEPEAHDTWDPGRSRLAPGEQAFLRHVMRELDQTIRDMQQRPFGGTETAPNIGLGRKLAMHFVANGRLYPPPPARTTSATPKPSARLGEIKSSSREDGWVTTEHSIQVNLASYEKVEITCSIGIAVEGGGSSSSSSRADEAPQAHWVISGESEPSNVAIVRATTDDASELVLRVRQRGWHRVTPAFTVTPMTAVTTEEV